MPSENCQSQASKLDKFCLYAGAAFPFALIIGNSAFEAVVALVGLSWLGGLLINRRNPLPNLLNDPLVLPWIAWYGTIIISLLINGSGSKGWSHDIVLFRQLIFMTALLDISRRMDVAKTLVIGLAAGVVWAALNLVIAYLIGHDLMGNSLAQHQSKIYLGGRIAGLTSYTGPLFCCYALLRWKEMPKTRILAMAIGVASFVLVVHSGVRTNIVAAFLGLIGCLCWQFGKRFSRKQLAVTGMGLALLLGVAAQNVHLSQVNNVVNLSSMYARVAIWQVSTAMWQDSPFVGTGISSFSDVYQDKAKTFSPDDAIIIDGITFPLVSETTHAHNIILVLLVCTGVFGLLAFGWLFFRLVSNSLEIQNEHPEVIAVLTSFIIGGLSGFNIYHSWYISLFAYLVALAGVLFRQGAKRIS